MQHWIVFLLVAQAPAGDASANHIFTHELRSQYQAETTLVRVLLPDRPPAGPMRVLYVLPVEAKTETRYGDGLVEVKRLDIHNQYGLACVAPTFSALPWYADHPTDPGRRQESYFLEVVRFVDEHYPVRREAEARLLLGFSKSGWGATSLIARHPELFARAAAWDAPLDVREPTKYGMSVVFPTPESFEPYYLPRALERAKQQLAGTPRLGIFGYGNFRASMAAMHEKLDAARVPHVYHDGPKREHVWSSGWIPEAVEFLAK